MRTPAIEEHELPPLEAALAATIVLMTGYSQALQADLHPAERLQMGASIERHLAVLTEHPLLSASFRHVLGGLQQRWEAIGRCTAEAGRDAGKAALSVPFAVARVPGRGPLLH